MQRGLKCSSERTVNSAKIEDAIAQRWQAEARGEPYSFGDAVHLELDLGGPHEEGGGVPTVVTQGKRRDFRLHHHGCPWGCGVRQGKVYLQEGQRTA